MFYFCVDKGLKGTVVNRTCTTLNGGSLKIAPMSPFKSFKYLETLKTLSNGTISNYFFKIMN